MNVDSKSHRGLSIPAVVCRQRLPWNGLSAASHAFQQNPISRNRFAAVAVLIFLQFYLWILAASVGAGYQNSISQYGAA